MGEKLIVGPINRALRTDRLPFAIDDDSFPVMINAYQWRGRVKRKRGTSNLCRLMRFYNSTSTVYSSSTTITLDAAGNGNILTGFGLQSLGNIVISTLSIHDTIANITYTDPLSNGTLVGMPSGSGIINYSTGGFQLSAVSFGHTVTVTMNYTPDLPVMGIEDLVLDPSQFPGSLDFDTTYSYIIQTFSPYFAHDVSFYKNPNVSTSLPNYVPKATQTPTPVTWNGQTYQQFWTINYENALWATNGITVPFGTANIGMQFAGPPNVAYVSSVSVLNGPSTITVTITPTPPAICPLVIGDFVFLNEWTVTATALPATGLNFQTGYVTAIAGTTAALTVTITLPNATIGAGGFTPGIIQYLTNRSDVTKDCIRWFDGDPTDGNPTNPTFQLGKGWVNFMPPLSRSNFSISNAPAAIYYLVGARLIEQFKDRLLFIGPVIQTSTQGANPIYLPDTVIYSQNGTPYYTSSSTGDPTLPTADFHPVLTPINQTATSNAWWEDQTGFGGFIPAGINQAIVSSANNEDVLIFGSATNQMRFIYTGNDVLPFNFYLIDSELSTGSTFSTINMGDGIITRGDRGFIITSQREAKRIDLDILDQQFEINLQNNGAERFTAQRDFLNEWIYFTYRSNQRTSIFPNQTLQYNYRDDSWAIFNESYTTYGQFRKVSGLIWATVGSVYPTWSQWNVPWNAGSSTILAPEVIGGNQQGFVILRDEGTGEANSLQIISISFPSAITGASQSVQAILQIVNSFAVGQQITISGVVGMTQLNGNTYTIVDVTPGTVKINVNSTLFTPYVSGGIATPSSVIYLPDHGLNAGDYIVISGALGTIGAQVNGKIFSVAPTVTQNGFNLNPSITAGTYLGGGLIQRMYVPFIQTKQFPVAWDMGRKTRIGVQQYLLSSTPNGRIQLLIFLSQNSASAYNQGNIVPQNNVLNNSLIYSTTLFTCPESTNLGLTPYNTNLQMINIPSNTAGTPGTTDQAQMWHRINTSLIGDTIQLGFTMSDEQMRDILFRNQFTEIELHGFILDVTPSQMLC